MQVKFYSELLDEYFDTKDACAKAEAEIKEKKQKGKELYENYQKSIKDYEIARHNLKTAEKEYLNFKAGLSATSVEEINKSKLTDEELNSYLGGLLKYLFT